MLIKKNLIKSEKNLNELCRKLNSLFRFLDEVYHINSGGCCYVASVLAELLEEDDVDYSVIVYDCDCDDFYDISCSCYHYTLRITGAEEYCNIVNGYDEEECDDYELDDYDYCYECSGYGDDYHVDDDGELVCRCPTCLMNPSIDWDDYED